MTRANIAVVIDGKVYAAYLNHDGYPPYIGPRLMNGYLNPKDPETNLRKIKTLCTNGEIYTLGSFIKTSSLSGDDGRGIPSRTFDTLDEFAIFLYHSMNDYCYIFIDGAWYYFRPFDYRKAEIKHFDEYRLEPLDISYRDDEYAEI